MDQTVEITHQMVRTEPSPLLISQDQDQGCGRSSNLHNDRTQFVAEKRLIAAREHLVNHCVRVRVFSSIITGHVSVNSRAATIYQ